MPTLQRLNAMLDKLPVRCTLGKVTKHSSSAPELACSTAGFTSAICTSSRIWGNDRRGQESCV